jgi:hypothetical protein
MNGKSPAVLAALGLLAWNECPARGCQALAAATQQAAALLQQRLGAAGGRP